MPRIAQTDRSVSNGVVYDPAAGISSTDHTHPNLDVLNNIGSDSLGVTFAGEHPDADLEEEAW